ncbi:MAG: copper uptake system-associated protein [Methylophilus sp.]|nr:copper uptake system-associated protein [Methylophilus sp.]
MSASRKYLPIMILLFVSLVALMSKGIAEVAQTAAVEATIKAQWEKPNHPIRVPVVVMSGEHAIADWIQEPKGGRALLKLTDGHWHTLMCGDANLAQTNHLISAGVPLADAERLSIALKQAETKLSQDERATINSFNGMIDMLKAPQHHEQHTD